MTPRGGIRQGSGRKARADKPAEKIVSIRFTEEEYKKIMLKAISEELTIVDYIRRLVL